MKIDINKYIVADPKICHGKPTFKGTRIMVWQILEMLEGGLTTKQIIENFPSLTKDQIKAALHYATDITKGKDNVIVAISANA